MAGLREASNLCRAWKVEYVPGISALGRDRGGIFWNVGTQAAEACNEG